MSKELKYALLVWVVMLVIIVVCWVKIPAANTEVSNTESIDISEVSEVASAPDESYKISKEESFEISREESIDISEVNEESFEEIIEESIDENSIIMPNKVIYYDVPMDKDLQDHIIRLCREYSLDPAIVFAMIDLESNFDPLEVGDGGDSKGLMQVQAKWHQDRMDELGVTDLFDPYQNVTIGIDYLGEMNRRGKSIEWVLMAYNGGPIYANRKVSQGIVTKYAERIIRDSKLIGVYEDYSENR